jgi:protein SCO1/2
MQTKWTALAMGIVMVVGASCRPLSEEGRGESGEVSRTLEAAGLRTYAVTGTVHQVKVAQRVLVIAHETIPGYMMAMTMPFEVKDTNELAWVEPGDILTFRMLVSETEGWIDSLVKVGHDPSVAPEVLKGPRRAPMVEPLAVGDAVPEYTFTNQFGNGFQLSDFRGEVLGLTFFFTRCPYPTFCPRTSANMAATAKALAEEGNGLTNWHLLQISFDPDYDTPKILEAYAEGYGYDPDRWTFATGDLMQIDGLTEQLGCMFGRDGESYSHNVRTAVLDTEGRVSLIITGNTWTAETLVGAMQAAGSVGSE